MITEERDYAAAIRYAAPVLRGAHTRENDRGAPGDGLVLWGAVFETLASVSGCMRLMLETYIHRSRRSWFFAGNLPKP